MIKSITTRQPPTVRERQRSRRLTLMPRNLFFGKNGPTLKIFDRKTNKGSEAAASHRTKLISNGPKTKVYLRFRKHSPRCGEAESAAVKMKIKNLLLWFSQPSSFCTWDFAEREKFSGCCGGLCSCCYPSRKFTRANNKIFEFSAFTK